MADALLQAEDVNLSDPTFWRRPRSERFQAFDLLRSQAPVSWQPAPTPWAPAGERPPRGYWAITTYEDARAVSRDPVTFCSGRGVMLFDNLSPGDQYLNDGWVGEEAAACIERVVERGECDFFADVASPLPIGVICEMLGIPSSERDEVIRLTHEGVHFAADVPFEDTLRAVSAVIEYAKTLARRRRADPADDLMSSLVWQEVDGHRLSDEDVAATFWVIITGGTDTTSTAAAHAMIAFTEWPEERQKLQASFDRFAGSAVEEILRWSTPVIDFRRTATRDTELHGQRIGEGDNVVIFYQSANRDDSAFTAPYRFDVAREPNPHLAFGGGGRTSASEPPWPGWSSEPSSASCLPACRTSR
jgi:cytochrome P450